MHGNIMRSFQTQRQGALLHLRRVRHRVGRVDRSAVDAFVGVFKETRDVTAV